MTYTVQELAQKYAEALVAYHAAKIVHAQGGSAKEFRAAQNDLFMASEQLDHYAIRAAELQLGLSV